jgi:hypothetical protein
MALTFASSLSANDIEELFDSVPKVADIPFLFEDMWMSDMDEHTVSRHYPDCYTDGVDQMARLRTHSALTTVS